MTRKYITNTQIYKKLEKIQKSIKKPDWNKILFQILLALTIGIVTGLATSYYSGTIFIPEYFEHYETYREGNLFFTLKTKMFSVGDEGVTFSYNFTGINNYTKRWTNDITLELYYPYPYNYTITEINIFTNPQDITPEIEEKPLIEGITIYFSWDLVQERINETSGQINLVFDVVLQSETGHHMISSEFAPIYRLKVQDVGEYPIDEQGVIIYGS